jgi:hypothetical protein
VVVPSLGSFFVELGTLVRFLTPFL